MDSRDSRFGSAVEVGSAVDVGFDSRGLACITGDFLRVLNLRVLALPSRMALIIGVWLLLRWVF